MNQPPDLILPTGLLDPVDRGDHDLYLPEDAGRPPVVVLVHGLFPEPPPVAPRRTPFFRAYAAQLALRGTAAVVLDHELTGGMRYPEAAATLDRVLSAVRSDDAVDGDTVAVWFFSGGGPLAHPILAAGPPWLRCVALTYPLLPVEPIPGCRRSPTPSPVWATPRWCSRWSSTRSPRSWPGSALCSRHRRPG